jgi:hypothetical protein
MAQIRRFHSSLMPFQYPMICSEYGIGAATFYSWKQKFGGMDQT